jgi:DnaJ family protein B protein 4
MRERHFELANVSVHDLNPSRPSLQTRTSTEYKIPYTPRTRDSSTTLRTFSSSSRQSSFESVTTAPSYSRLSMLNASTSCDTLPSVIHGASVSYSRAPPPQSISNVLESNRFRTSTERPPIFGGPLTDSPIESKLPNIPRRSTDDSTLYVISKVL